MLDLASFGAEVGRDGICLVTFDQAGPVNMLSPALFDDLTQLLDRVERDDTIKAVVLASAKPDFIVGADIRWFDTLTDMESTVAAIRTLHEALARLEALHRQRRKPLVAAIHGACLGGGNELALAASMRIATNDPTTQLGQPEVQLGLIPAGGGTQRLPALVGIASALDIILTGRPVSPRRALEIGLLDEVVPPEVLLDIARKRALESAHPEPRLHRRSARRMFTPDHLRRLALERNPVGRRVLFSKARTRMLDQTKGNYPAPPLALEAVRIGIEDGPEAGYTAEARFLAELVPTAQSRALRSLFFATRELKKETWVPDGVAPAAVDKVGILGGGLMGAGIAAISVLRTDSAVRIKEVDDAGVRRGLGHVQRALETRVQRRRLGEFEAERAMNRVTGTVDWSGFGNVGLVIEAVFEDLELKRSLLQQAESVMPEDAVFASNTSSLPIAAIAEGAARPQNVIGMHYFSPVERMPLLEVVIGPQTSDRTTATAVEFGKRQGKTVIVVTDGTGFYTSRIIAPYTNEVGYLLEDGASVEAIDGAMEAWGFPVGPLQLIDEVGIDVGAKIAGIMTDAFGVRLRGPAMLNRLVVDGRSGRKNGRGFYRYDTKGKRGAPDESVYETLGLGPRTAVPVIEIQDRLALAMVNEAAHCLDEGILQSPRDGDIGAVLGLGFPPFRGGPFRYVDEIGAAQVVSTLEDLAERHGDRFTPAGILTRRAANGRSFFT